MVDEDLPRPKDDVLLALAQQDLDRLSVVDLDQRVAFLDAELVRTRAKRDAAAAFRQTADNLFKR